MAADVQQQAQSGLVHLLGEDMLTAWGLLDVHRLKATIPDLSAATAALVQRYGKIAGAIAARFYTRQRRASGVPGVFRPIPADPPGLEQVQSGVEWALRGLWGAEPDIPAAQTQAFGVAETLVLDTGRTAILDAVQADPEAKGWARLVEPGACAFCLLLATRGAVYKAEETADFQAHPSCRCHAEPVFTAYEPSAEVRHWTAVYRRVAADKRGKDKRAAFRQAVEGRLPQGESS